MQSEERLRAIERATDVPLLVLAVVMIPLLIAPLTLSLSDEIEAAVLAADWLIWGAFAADFGVKLVVAPRRLNYVATHPFEAAMVLLPFLRPLRAARLLRFARVAAALGLNLEILREIGNNKGARFIVGAVLACLVFGAVGAFLTERGEAEANITSFGDALWWSVTTMTTVGYGDRFPTTPEGRGIAAVLMVFGIAALSAMTATIAALLVREDTDAGPSNADILAELQELRREMAELSRENREGSRGYEANWSGRNSDR